METAHLIERSGVPVPPIIRKGRKKGSGCNLKLLQRMKVGDSIWDVPEDKMISLRSSAFRGGLSIRIRKVEDNNYAIWKL